MNNDCIFCKIIAKQLPAQIIKETDDIIVIKDIAPKAPIHYLIIPKEHTQDLSSTNNKELLGKLFSIPKVLVEEFAIPAFRLVVNNGKDAGQCVFHLHIHFLSGKYQGF